jgi:hypothetical protein
MIIPTHQWEFTQEKGRIKEIGVNEKLKEYIEDFEKIKYTKGYERKIFLRDIDPQKVIEFVAAKFKIKDPMLIMRKWEREAMEFRATLAYILNVLCGLTYSQICDIMHNITEACCANLCKKGFAIVNKGNFEEFYSELI